MKRFLFCIFIIGLILPAGVWASSNCEGFKVGAVEYGCDTSSLAFGVHVLEEQEYGSEFIAIGKGECLDSMAISSGSYYNVKIRCTDVRGGTDLWVVETPEPDPTGHITRLNNNSLPEHAIFSAGGRSLTSEQIKEGQGVFVSVEPIKVMCQDGYAPNADKNNCVPAQVVMPQCIESGATISELGSFNGNVGDILLGGKVLVTGSATHVYCFPESELNNWTYNSPVGQLHNVCKENVDNRILAVGDRYKLYRCLRDGWVDSVVYQCTDMTKQCNEDDKNCVQGILDTSGNVIDLTTAATQRNFSMGNGAEVCWGFVCKQGFELKENGSCGSIAVRKKQEVQQQQAQQAIAVNKKKCEESWGKWENSKCECDSAKNLVLSNAECVCKSADYERNIDSKSCTIKNVAKLQQDCETAIKNGVAAQWDEAGKACVCKDALYRYEAQDCKMDAKVAACKAVRNATWIGGVDGHCECNLPKHTWNGAQCVDKEVKINEDDEKKDEEEQKRLQIEVQIRTATKRIEASQKSLDEIIDGLKLTVWRDEEGNFNTSRLVSDSVAGVVLGTAGALITSSVVKKNQVENGFEDIQCTIGGQKVADWGDQFRVGIQ